MWILIWLSGFRTLLSIPHTVQERAVLYQARVQVREKEHGTRDALNHCREDALLCGT